jgi:hypothetical protein
MKRRSHIKIVIRGKLIKAKENNFVTQQFLHFTLQFKLTLLLTIFSNLHTLLTKNVKYNQQSSSVFSYFLICLLAKIYLYSKDSLLDQTLVRDL